MNTPNVQVSAGGHDCARKLLKVISMIAQSASRNGQSQKTTEMDEALQLFAAAINSVQVAPPPRTPTGTRPRLQLVH